MTTTEAAAQLEVSGEFIRGEIRDGRLEAMTIVRPGKRTVYRISPSQLDAYREAYWHVPRETISQYNQ